MRGHPRNPSRVLVRLNLIIGAVHGIDCAVAGAEDVRCLRNFEGFILF